MVLQVTQRGKRGWVTGEWVINRRTFRRRRKQVGKGTTVVKLEGHGRRGYTS